MRDRAGIVALRGGVRSTLLVGSPGTAPAQQMSWSIRVRVCAPPTAQPNERGPGGPDMRVMRIRSAALALSAPIPARGGAFG
jgi:hypothetical protein